MLGIVIASWNGEKLIDKCLDSLSKQSYQDFKVYIIDNASKDNSKNVINSYKEKINIDLTELDYNSGFAVANNIGIKKAINDGVTHVLTLNNDVEVEEDCLKVAMENIQSKYKDSDVFQLFMINYFEREKCDAAGLVFNEKLFVDLLGYEKKVKDVLAEEFEIEGPCAGAAIYSAKALEKVKLNNGDYFDGNFFAYYEDVDLALRLKRAGFKSRLLKDSVVYHMHSATSNTTSNKTSAFKEYYLARNLFLYTKRNQSIESFNRVKSSYYKLLIRKCIKYAMSPAVVKAILKGIKDGVSEMKEIEYIQY